MKLLPKFLLRLSPQKLLIFSLSLTSLSLGLSSVDRIADQRRCEEVKAQIAQLRTGIAQEKQLKQLYITRKNKMSELEKDVQRTEKRIGKIKTKRKLTSAEIRHFDSEIKRYRMRIKKINSHFPLSRLTKDNITPAWR